MVARLSTPVPMNTPPEFSDSVSYEWDPSNDATKKKWIVELAKRDCKCIRCLTELLRGQPRVGFESWDTDHNHAVTRWYHLECFAKFPCRDIDNFASIKFKDGVLDKFKSLLNDSLSHYQGVHRPKEARVTSTALEGVRAVTKVLRDFHGISSKAAVELSSILRKRSAEEAIDGNDSGGGGGVSSLFKPVEVGNNNGNIHVETKLN